MARNAKMRRDDRAQKAARRAGSQAGTAARTHGRETHTHGEAKGEEGQEGDIAHKGGLKRELSALLPVAPDGQGSVSTSRWSAKPYIHVAHSLSGEWEKAEVQGAPQGAPASDFGWDNPAPFVYPNGTVLLLTRYNVPGWSAIWVSRAPSFRGPYEFISGHGGDFSPSDTSQEDPTIWQDHRGHMHALFHFSGSHAFSRDGLTWHWGSDDAWEGGMLDGISLLDAERPRMWIDPSTRRPGLLFFASGGEDQPIAKDGVSKGFTAVRAVLH